MDFSGLAGYQARFFMQSKREMLSEFETRIADFINANRLCESADKILLAVSGGADSTTLLYVMHALKAEGILSAELLCAHINHQLRGVEAERDEDFVIAQAGELNVSVTTKHVDVRSFAHKNKLSIETAARKLRIEALVDIAKANDCRWVTTAHQKNDNAETVLHRLLRGTGFRGLGGIRPVQTFDNDIEFVRPLLCVGRDEIVEYLKERNLKWQTDRTNYDCTYRRNYIRHRLIPVLQRDCGNPVVEELSELSRSAQKFHSLVCSYADRVWPEVAECDHNNVKLNVQKFLIQPTALKTELIRRSLATIGSGEGDLTQVHFEKILQLAEQRIGNKKVELPNAFVVHYEYRKLTFARNKKLQAKKQASKSVEVEVPGQTRFGRYLVEATVLEAEQEAFEKFKAEKNEFVEWFDLDKVKPPLVVRFRRAGDRFRPLGLAGEKRVGKFLTAARIPQQIREKMLIVADAEKMIWLWPARISEETKIDSRTRNILQLQITEMGSA
jgi:tRNA(Ile)-lysidine synthase